jgi:exodeoxyribonuclease-3
MKFISWNVNGLRACMNKGFLDTFHNMNADFFCLQETKLQAGQITMDLPGYEQYWNYAQKKGYSGTAIFTRHSPLSVTYGLGNEALDTEGRLITLEYPDFFLVNCYTPNAQRGLARIDHRLQWEDALRSYLLSLDSQKPVIYCGDLNVAHQEIDLKNPGSNKGNAGFSDEERGAFSALLDSGFTDTFRHLYPDATGAYSWWSYMFNARQNNAGWRIDYFLVSSRIRDQIAEASIHPNVFGSDHCPVELQITPPVIQK